MTIIKIDSFGGELPSVSPRNIGKNGASTAKNLFAPTPEFRPLSTDSTIATTLSNSNPVTLYKTYRSTAGGAANSETQGWRSNSVLVNYVKGQIDDDQTERTYYSYNDGVTAPRAFDVAGVDKLLGVPAPDKPVVVPTYVDEYTVEEDIAARKSIPLAMRQAAIDSAIYTAIGNGQSTMVAGAEAGWLPHGTSVSAGTLPTTNLGDYAFLVKMTSSPSGGYVLPTSYQFLSEVGFGGRQVTYGGSVYWAIPVTLQGMGYLIDTATLTAGLIAIDSPNPNGPVNGPGYTNPHQLYSDATCALNAGIIHDWLDVTAEPQKASIAALNSAQTAMFYAMTNYTNDAVNATMVKDFYAKSAVSAELTAAVDLYAARVLQTLQIAYNEDAGTGSSLDASAAVKTSIVALFPTSWTVAGVGSNAYVNFLGDGTLQASADVIRAAVATIIEAEVTADAALIADATTVKNRVLGDMDLSYTALLTGVVAPSHWSTKYPNEFPLSTSYSRLNAALASIAEVKRLADKVTNDYVTVIAKIDSIITNIFDAEGGIAESWPEPVTRITDARYYVVTWVTAWGEESAPSLPSDLADDIDSRNDFCTVSRPATVPADRGIVGWRIYRTNTGNASANFQLVPGGSAETGVVLKDGTFDYFSTSASSYDDKLLSSDLQEVLQSLTWLPPDSRLQGLSGMANGIMAGFYDNVLCFCEAYYPYAWPIEYQLTTKSAIVGLGAFGTSLAVLTVANPYIASGSDSASMSLQEVGNPQACVSKRSIVSVEGGVLYASPDGICLIDSSGVKVVSQGLFTKEDWTLLAPSGIVAALHEGVYYFTYTGNGGGSYGLDFTARKLVSLDLSGSAFYLDKYTDTLYQASGTAVKGLFSGTGKRTGIWKTGLLTLPKHEPFAWLQVFSDFTAPVIVRWYGDGALRYTATLTSIAPVRLPAGRYLEHQIEIESAARITSTTFAGLTLELQSA